MTEKIDVCMMTKNEPTEIFRKCLMSIKRSDIPINCFIVVDGGSPKETIDLIYRVFEDAFVIYDEGNLASSRTKAIAEVETEWFAFIDSDVVVPPDWYSQISRYKKFGDGLESWNWNWGKGDFNKMKTLRGECNPSSRDHRDRARTIADLIRTRLVKEIQIPEDLFMLEDEYIRRYMEKKGGIWLKTGVRIDHYPHDWGVPPFRDGYLRGRYKFCTQKSLIIKAFGNMIFRKKGMTHYWKMWAGYVWGRLNAAD